MGKEAFVDRKETLRTNSFKQAVEHSIIQISGLIVHPWHNGVCVYINNLRSFPKQAWMLRHWLTWWMHDTANNKAATQDLPSCPGVWWAFSWQRSKLATVRYFRNRCGSWQGQRLDKGQPRLQCAISCVRHHMHSYSHAESRPVKMENTIAALF